MKQNTTRMKILVLGAGMVGRAIALDLSKDYSVTSVDINPDHLKLLSNRGIQTKQANLSDSEIISELVENQDIAVSCVPGFMGFNLLKQLIKLGIDTVDISFMPENFLELDQLAKEHEVTAIADCGVAPGMPNLFLGYQNKRMKVLDFFYMVGGLPMERSLPFQYKAPFSPIDVIEEYTRPARCVENGKLVTKEALSEPQLYRFDGLGDLEGFNTDGLRSLLITMKHIPNMKEKTLRYPGHISLISALKSAGFFSTNPINYNNQKVIPLEITSKILIEQWKLKPNEPEFTVMRIIIKGEKNGVKETVTYNLYDEYNPQTKQWSMARTTGYTATAAVNLIAKQEFTKKGVFPPEFLGEDEICYSQILDYLKERGIYYEQT